LIVVDAVTSAHHCGDVTAEGPRKTNARRKVVSVGLEAAARHTVRTHRHQRPGCRVVDIGPILGIDRRRIVFVAQPGVECQPRCHAKAIIHKEVVTLSPNLLRVIDVGHTRQQRKSEQQIGDSVAGDLRKRRELQASARLDIAKSILLREAQVGAEFHQMTAADIAGVVEHLIDIRNAVLRIIAFITQRGKTGHGNKAESQVAWPIRGGGQANVRIEMAGLLRH